MKAQNKRTHMKELSKASKTFYKDQHGWRVSSYLTVTSFSQVLLSTMYCVKLSDYSSQTIKHHDLSNEKQYGKCCLVERTEGENIIF